MTDLDLDAIEARANAATDGPWGYPFAGKNRITTPVDIDVTEADWGGENLREYVLSCLADRNAWRAADAEFIAHARTDVPALVAALREARDLLNAKESWIEGAKVDLDGYDEALAEAERLTCRHHLSSDGDEGPVVNLPGLRVVRWHCNECDGKWYDDNALAHLRDTIRSQTDSLNAAEAEVERLRTQHAADLDRVTLLRAGAVVAERDDWRRRYEALRDGVTGLCDEADRNHEEYLRGIILDRFIVPSNVTVRDLRAVVARVEES